ncbi:MAG: CRISPR-associated protein Cas4 [Smithella sp.]|nr:CRISPR-associated protein Cas4 [Smithella sp.]
MKPEYTPDELLPLSGIQHFYFCRRQWALIHVEQHWQDNVLTLEGKLLHKKVDDPFVNEKRGDVIIVRSVPVSSYQLGLSGVCDVVEFIKSSQGVHLPGREGLFSPFPVEYKHGKPKSNPVDELQLCAQALCLEEMLSIEIFHGFFYYGEIRHRIEVELTPKLRALVSEMSEEMHAYFRRGYTPRVKPSKACRSCSLADICLPDLLGQEISAMEYISQNIARG